MTEQHILSLAQLTRQAHAEGEAEVALRHALAAHQAGLASGDPDGPQLLTWLLNERGDYADALEALREALAHLPGWSVDLFGNAMYSFYKLDPAELSANADLLTALRLGKIPDGQQPLIDLMSVYAVQDLRDDALDVLQQLLAQHPGAITEVEADPDFEALRQDPRYRQITDS